MLFPPLLASRTRQSIHSVQGRVLRERFRVKFFDSRRRSRQRRGRVSSKTGILMPDCFFLYGGDFCQLCSFCQLCRRSRGDTPDSQEQGKELGFGYRNK